MVIVRRGLISPLRAFLAYSCLEVLWAVVSLFFFLHDPLFYHTGTYFAAFWAEQTISLLLGVMVIKEVFSSLFQPYTALHDLSGSAFRWLVLTFVLIALISGALAPGVDQQRVVAGVYVLERSVRTVQVGALLFLFAFSKALGVSWRSHPFGVATGFGTLATFRLVAVALRAQTDYLQPLTLVLSGVGEICAVLIWTVYLLVPEHAHELNELPSVQLEQWNQALAGLLRR